MQNKIRAGLAALLMVAVSGCAVKGGWMGAEAEKAYDKDLEAKRLAEANNNDDYYEIHKDGRIYVLSDAKDYKIWLSTDEIPLVVTRIGVGPKGETVKMGLIKREAKAMEAIVGYKGGAQRLFEGELKGLEKGFYGEVTKNGQTVVFNDWNVLDAYRKGGSLSGGVPQDGLSGPHGEKVLFVATKGPVEDMTARFQAIYAKK